MPPPISGRKASQAMAMVTSVTGIVSTKAKNAVAPRTSEPSNGRTDASVAIGPKNIVKPMNIRKAPTPRRIQVIIASAFC